MADSPRVPLASFGPDAPRELDAYFRLWARTDTGPASYWHTGFMYALTEGRKLVPLVRYSGLFRIFVEPREGAYRATVADAVMFSDAAGQSGEPLDRLRNPLTGRTVRVRHFFEGPFSLEATESAERMVVDGSPGPVLPFRARRWQQCGPQVAVSRDIFESVSPGGATVATNAATATAERAPVQVMTLATFSAPLAALRDTRSSSAAEAILSQQFAGPWMPWLGMTEIAGATVSCGTGRKLEPDLADLPRALRSRVGRVHPSILRSVEHWAGTDR